MTLTRAELQLVLEEIRSNCLGAKIQRVREVSPDKRILQLRIPGQTHSILVSVKPDFARLHLIETVPEQPPSPTPFTMLLRKHLVGAELRSVKLIQNDRIAEFSLEAETTYCVVAELTGHHPNLYLLDDDRTILGLRRAESLGKRQFQRYDTYQPPPPPPNTDAAEQVRWQLDERDPETLERSRTLEAEYTQLEQQQTLDHKYQTLKRRLEKRIDSLEDRLDGITTDLRRAREAEKYKHWGELLQSAWGDVQKGDESVTVRDFYTEDLREVEVPLDPSKTLQENISHYFHQYQRYSEAEEKIKRRKKESENLLQQTKRALEKLDEHCNGAEQLEEFENDLEERDILEKQSTQTSRSGQRRSERKPYRQFESINGSRILVGKSASDNDTLTTSIARGRDFWFHARNFTGSHVVLRMPKYSDGPDSEELIDAATLAAWFSKGRTDTSVEVIYTRAKHVHKPKGYPSGQVTFSEDSNITVAIEGQRVERLLDHEQD